MNQAQRLIMRAAGIRGWRVECTAERGCDCSRCSVDRLMERLVGTVERRVDRAEARLAVLRRPPVYDQADAHFQAGRRQADGAPQPPHGEPQARRSHGRPVSQGSPPTDAERAALANVAEAASQARAAAPDGAPAPTLTDTLAGLREAESAVFEALVAFESKFRGCIASDIRIERVAPLAGGSRIVGVLIDMKVQNP